MDNKSVGGIQAIHFVKAFVLSALLTVILLFGCAFLLLKTGLSDKALGICLAGVDALAAFVGGIYLGRKAGQQKFLWGLIFGILYFLVYLILNFLVAGNKMELESILKTFFIMAAGGMAGGMVS